MAGADDLDRLIVVKLDRLGRSAPDLLRPIERFTSCGCAVVSVSEAIDTSTATGAVCSGLSSPASASSSATATSERVREVERAKAQAGRPTTDRATTRRRFDDVTRGGSASGCEAAAGSFTDAPLRAAPTWVARGLRSRPTTAGGQVESFGPDCIGFRPAGRVAAAAAG
jgi:hypothetical protein